LKQVPSKALPDDIFLLAVDHRGGEQSVPAIEGWRVMKVIRDAGIDLTASRKGTCAGCQVYGEPWLERLPAANERDRLYEAFGVEPAFRRCCQILMSPGLNGQRMGLAPGSELE
jgi:ferredoxin, 2Fe-2S